MLEYGVEYGPTLVNQACLLDALSSADVYGHEFPLVSVFRTPDHIIYFV